MYVGILAQNVPCALSRERRIALLLEAAAALEAGEPVPFEAAKFLGGALSAWLSAGGSLERQHLRVSAIAGSHHTPTFIARQITASAIEDAGDFGEVRTFETSSQGEQAEEEPGSIES